MEGEREQTEWGERVGMREERKSGCERGEIERVVEKEVREREREEGREGGNERGEIEWGKRE
jgi:hypothetical protein